MQRVSDATVLAALLAVLFLGCVRVGGGILQACSTASQTLSTNSTVNVSCTSVALSNMVVQGSMMFNISISGIVAANPGSQNITVTVTNMTVQAGAVLAIDCRWYNAISGGPKVSIMVQSLIGSDGCLVFLGSFPSGTTILVSGAKMTSSTASAPKLPTLDSTCSASYSTCWPSLTWPSLETPR